MQYWVPDSETIPGWKNSDVYIIGGGPSLSGFDFSLLYGKNVIGCNAVFKSLGVAKCPVTFFSDKKWFFQFEDELEFYVKQGGIVVTQSLELRMVLRDRAPAWLKIMQREKNGLHKRAIGFNNNSGCSAVNLALILGARRVFMLGFDCRLEPTDKTHWHNWRIEKPNPAVYAKFINGWNSIADALPKVFPESEIINLGPDSAIECFPKGEVTNFLSHAENYQCAG